MWEPIKTTQRWANQVSKRMSMEQIISKSCQRMSQRHRTSWLLPRLQAYQGPIWFRTAPKVWWGTETDTILNKGVLYRKVQLSSSIQPISRRCKNWINNLLAQPWRFIRIIIFTSNAKPRREMKKVSVATHHSSNHNLQDVKPFQRSNLGPTVGLSTSEIHIMDPPSG